MRIKRKEFLKRSLKTAAGLALLPPVFINKFDSFGKANTVPPKFTPDPASWKDDEVNIAWIGHATILINFYGTIILTDPVLFDRVGLYFFGLTYGPARFTAPALEFENMPRPDIILLSHGHMDHTDYKTLVNFTDEYPGQIDCITAYNTRDITEELEWKSIKELDWGDEYELHGIKFKTLEVKHFGWRYPWEKDRSKGFMKDGRSYNAYILEKNGKKILFGGDTAFHEKFLAAKDENIDVAIMPVGAYHPWRINHCNPEEALIMASLHMKAKHFIPIHCNTFKQGMEPVDQPLSWLNDSVTSYEINLGIRNIGETFTLKS
jgi:L-ascorbate metabolism protein UlaG (beta-lactamase superfamily)